MRIFCLTILCVVRMIALGQTEIVKLSPISPDAAAIQKFWEIPVNTFSGIPGIEVPLYSVKGRQLGLNLSLSYHAGGNRYDDVASWVGLGWSLGSIPVINRSVRGLADDGGGGYFTRYQNKSVQEIYEQRFSTTATIYNNLLDEVREGHLDTEPDIFNYSLPGKSGKFYYNQVTQKFHTIPHQNIKIEYTLDGFKITDDNGDVYIFDIREYSCQTDLIVPGSPTCSQLNSWWVSKIKNANNTDSIEFQYTLIQEAYSRIASETRSIYYGGQLCTFDPFQMSSYSNIFDAVKISQIKFSQGVVNFIPKNAIRSDIQSGKALDRIEIFNHKNEYVKGFQFYHSYSSNRLILDSIKEKGVTGEFLNPYCFNYRKDITLQEVGFPIDYWGFYNGITTNTSFIPHTLYKYPLDTKPRKFIGGDRRINPDVNQFLILNKLTYPTKGFSFFEYEPNDVQDTNLPRQVIDTFVVLLGNGNPLGTNMFEKPFSINIPSDPYLNDNEVGGGGFVDIQIADYGCDLSLGANVCAIFNIKDMNGVGVAGPFTSNTKGIYLPNGNYKLHAEFYQEQPDYNYFAFGVFWQKPDPQYDGRRLVGGVRIKKITTVDNIVETTPTIMEYDYTGATSGSSSGVFFGSPIFSFQEVINYTTYDPNPLVPGTCHDCNMSLLKFSSYSNINPVVHVGSFVGYNKVEIKYGLGNALGKRILKYDVIKDMQDTHFPYAPSVSKEQRRGQLLEEITYSNAGDLMPVKKLVNQYQPYTVFSTNPISSSLDKPLKIATKDIVIDNCNSYYPFKPPQIVKQYDVNSDWYAPLLTQNIFIVSMIPHLRLIIPVNTDIIQKNW
jgi:hypothetical protein